MTRRDLLPFWELLATVDSVGEGWDAHSACRGVDPVLFFLERGESIEEASGFCGTCVVRGECLTVGFRERFGVWGGASENQRRAMRRQLNEQQGRAA